MTYEGFILALSFDGLATDFAVVPESRYHMTGAQLVAFPEARATDKVRVKG